MQKPISKLINGKTVYARKFSLAGVNEMALAVTKMQVGDTSMNQEEARAMTVKFDDDGNEVRLSDEEISANARSRIKISMFGMAEYQSTVRSLRLRHSVCNADGILRWKDVKTMEESIDADEADELSALVDKANPPKAATVELEEAEKN